MNIKNMWPLAKAKTSPPKNEDGIIINIAQEFKDRSRKRIKTWRDAILMAENPENPRWYYYQDLLDDLTLDAHLASAIDIRKAATLNHHFYVYDLSSGEELPEQTAFLEKKWFYDFLEVTMDAIFRKCSVVQLMRDGDMPVLYSLPTRNLCPQLGRLYPEVSGDKYLLYREEPGVVEIVHNSPFGILNNIVPNIIWKRNVLQAFAEFSEKFGMPLISATTNNRADVPRIEKMLQAMGEAGTAVLPNGTTIMIHPLAAAGDPEKCYVVQAKFHDDQTSKAILGSTTIADQGANRSQTEVHERTLDDKISVQDKRFSSFVVNDRLFPVLQQMGFPFDNTKMRFAFDETEDLTLKDHWSIVKDALQEYEIEDAWVAKTFKIPIEKRREKSVFETGAPFGANFR